MRSLATVAKWEVSRITTDSHQFSHRYTYVCGVANDTIGYIPDRQAYPLGGYQVWTGHHSNVAPGTAEAIADQTVKMLHTVGRL